MDIEQSKNNISTGKIFESNPIVKAIMPRWNEIQLGALAINTVGALTIGSEYLWAINIIESFVMINNNIQEKKVGIKLTEWNNTIVAISF
jgi:hypothetical protein